MYCIHVLSISLRVGFIIIIGAEEESSLEESLLSESETQSFVFIVFSFQRHERV